MKKNCVSLDLYRYFCSILIVALHTRPLAGISHMADMILVDIVGRLAVPFFFMAAGYFFIRQTLDENRKLSLYVYQILRIYLIWSIFYYIIDFIQWGHGDIAFFVRKCIFDFAVSGSREHLWFITTLVFSASLTYILFKIGRIKSLLPASLILYVIGCLGRAYYGIGSRIPVLNRLYAWSGYLTLSRFIFIGFPYFAAGYLIYRIQKLTHDLKNTSFLLIFVASLLFWISETVFLLKVRWALNLITSIGNYAFTVSIILLFLRYPLEHFERIGSLCRTLSKFTYYSQMFFISLIGHGLMLLYSVQASRPLKFFFTLTMTFLGGLLIEKTNSKMLKALVR